MTRRNLVDEATAVGAAVVGGVGVGLLRRLRRRRGASPQKLSTAGPRPGRGTQRYRGEYALFMEAYRRLEPWFDKL